MKCFKNKSGFSLIELLVASSIIITATTVVLAIITTSFRSSNKISSSQLVRQNGNYAINQMTKIIQFADSFEGASLTGEEGTFGACVPDTQYASIGIKYQKEDKVLICSDNNIQILTPGTGESFSLFDSSVVTGSCSFTCTQDNLSTGPVVGINFSLSLPNEGKSAEKSASGEFSTSVKMRNL
jgi:type II secretory pathway pseudopilin PulG